MSIDAQTWLTMLLVAGSALYVLRGAWAGIRAASAAKSSGCGGCNACGGCPTNRE